MNIKTESLLKIDDKDYKVDDVVSIIYSSVNIYSGTNVKIPMNTQNVKGRIIEILNDSVRLDCSTLYNGNEVCICYSDILNINK